MLIEEWKRIKGTEYYISNFGRCRRKLKNGYRYLKPFKEHNKYVVKVNGKVFTVARLVASGFIKPLTEEDCVYHKNSMQWDNYFRNLLVVNKKELGKMTGAISKSKKVVEVKNGEIIRSWNSTRKAGKELFISYQTVCDYCKGKVINPMYNLMWEEDYFDRVLPPFEWEHKRGRGRPKKN